MRELEAFAKSLCTQFEKYMYSFNRRATLRHEYCGFRHQIRCFNFQFYALVSTLLLAAGPNLMTKRELYMTEEATSSSLIKLVAKVKLLYWIISRGRS